MYMDLVWLISRDLVISRNALFKSSHVVLALHISLSVVKVHEILPAGYIFYHPLQGLVQAEICTANISCF